MGVVKMQSAGIRLDRCSCTVNQIDSPSNFKRVLVEVMQLGFGAGKCIHSEYEAGRKEGNNDNFSNRFLAVVTENSRNWFDHLANDCRYGVISIQVQSPLLQNERAVAVGATK